MHCCPRYSWRNCRTNVSRRVIILLKDGHCASAHYERSFIAANRPPGRIMKIICMDYDIFGRAKEPTYLECSIFLEYERRGENYWRFFLRNWLCVLNRYFKSMHTSCNPYCLMNVKEIIGSDSIIQFSDFALYITAVVALIFTTTIRKLVKKSFYYVHVFKNVFIFNKFRCV